MLSKGIAQHTHSSALGGGSTVAAEVFGQTETFTPHLNGTESLTSTAGQVWRVGDIAYIFLKFQITTIGTGDVNTIYCNVSDQFLPHTLQFVAGVATPIVYAGLSASVDTLRFRIYSGGTDLRIDARDMSATPTSDELVNVFQNSTNVALFGWYMTKQVG